MMWVRGNRPTLYSAFYDGVALKIGSFVPNADFALHVHDCPCLQHSDRKEMIFKLSNVVQSTLSSCTQGVRVHILSSAVAAVDKRTYRWRCGAARCCRVSYADDDASMVIATEPCIRW
jgi:hypothetical protein